jgi:hypothetical protein
MQLKEKTYYKTRDGKKAFVSAIISNPFVPFTGQPAIGFCEGIGQMEWREDGGFFREGWKQSTFDLISEWKEPVVVKRYVAWIRDGYDKAVRTTGTNYSTRAGAADSIVNPHTLLRIDEISYTDG